ncbi:MAG TPA: helix-turn-helix domain-containing protein [Planctomycetaceae bacterium]|jgi:AcrR family transcriptional regulator
MLQTKRKSKSPAERLAKMPAKMLARMPAKTPVKMSSEERRAAIIKAVRRVFAEKGFDGTTTRELAVAAGVSEALLFKHFPNKEALYTAMQISCCSDEEASAVVERLKALEPSASTLVFLIHFIISRIAGEKSANDDEGLLQTRLIVRSLMEDGEFARLFLKGRPTEGNRWIEACLKAAIAAGEAFEGPVRPSVGGWFTHHLAVMLKIHLLPAQPVVEYGIAHEKLVEQAVWFTLRGMGLKEETIKRYYNPKAIALFGG